MEFKVKYPKDSEWTTISGWGITEPEDAVEQLVQQDYEADPIGWGNYPSDVLLLLEDGSEEIYIVEIDYSPTFSAFRKHK